MRRPVIEVEDRQRPKKILLRDYPHWAELLPHLEQLGIEVSTAQELPLCEKEAAGLFKKEASGRRRPTNRPDIEAQYPNFAKWVNGYGWIEIGFHDWEGFQARALDEGGVIYEDAECDSFAAAMQALETGLEAWFKKQGR
jgi:hypothetical protein